MLRPTVAGFTEFVRLQGIAAAALPDGSVWFVWAFKYADRLVYHGAKLFGEPFYSLMVYNCGMDFLANYAPDNPPDTTFSDLRTKLVLTNFVPGLVQSTGDNSSNTSLMIPTSLSNLTLSDLQLLKTPWGQAYLALAQKIGTIWGLS